MTGRIVIILMLGFALIGGAGLYYLQVYHYYVTLDPATQQVRLTSLTTGQSETIPADVTGAIDATSSPIRYRACFTTPVKGDQLAQYRPADAPVPLTGPDWFDCFDADAIGRALASGQAQAFTGVKNIDYGVDRIVAIFDDGRGYVWHQLNNCGQRAYDGSAAGPECPARETESN